MTQPHRNRAVRGIYLGLGFISLGLGIAGIPLPLLPTTPFILLAGFFFARSSPRFDRWLTEHRVFGPMIQDWRAGRGMSVRAKSMAVSAIVLTFGTTIIFAISKLWVRVLLVAIAVSVATYLLRLPTKRVDAP